MALFPVAGRCRSREEPACRAGAGKKPSAGLQLPPRDVVLTGCWLSRARGRCACRGARRSGSGYFGAEVMMMAEGQGNGNDSPERDSAWQSAPGAEGSPGTPDADTDPVAADAASPG